ncbi:hypothetical protein GCM10010513_00010 [Streptomyces glebosus]|nr:hypothetical protein GCM10010513_00010 [Streptomyces glebosus]
MGFGSSGRAASDPVGRSPGESGWASSGKSTPQAVPDPKTSNGSGCHGIDPAAATPPRPWVRT